MEGVVKNGCIFLDRYIYLKIGTENIIYYHVDIAHCKFVSENAM